MCGYPTPKGDLYGGSHYIESATSKLTAQGIAIKKAAIDFGDGNTLPFCPCKRGYQPINTDGKKVYACHLHNNARIKRLKKENWLHREGEMNPSLFFGCEDFKTSATTTKRASLDSKTNTSLVDEKTFTK